MKRWKDINWLWAAGIFSIGYVAVVGSSLGWSRSWAFFTTDPKLNEAGDFLAGVFAPMALIWLVAAVLTQRQELNETRDQFTENQKVVDAQLKTINSQNELLTLQHQQAVENAAKAYRLSLFDKRYEIYEKFVRFDQEYETGDYDEAAYWKMINLSHEAAFVFDRATREWLEQIAGLIASFDRVRTENPVPMGPDNWGNHVPQHNEQSLRVETELNSYRIEIKSNFLPYMRTHKFLRFMSVSDQPYQ